MRTKQRIAKELFMTDNGLIVPFKPKQPIKLYNHELKYVFDKKVSERVKLPKGFAVDLSCMYDTISAASKAIGKTPARGSQLYTEGLLKCIRIWSLDIDIEKDELFKHLVNDYFLSNHGRVLKRYRSGEFRILKPLTTLGSQAQIGTDIVKAAGLRTSLMGPCVLEMFGKSRPSDEYVCIHINGDTTNNHLSNLRWGTRKEAAQNREKLGRGVHGGKDKVRVKVVEDCRTGLLRPHIGRVFGSICEAAREIGVSPMSIRQYIKNGKIVKL